MAIRKVLAFGVFDGVHPGHRAFFRQAKEHGDYLIVAVAQDHVVVQLKGRAPKKNLAERLVALEAERLVDQVVPGDDELGVYEVISLHRPDVIVLGYDQTDLKDDLERVLPNFKKKTELVTLDPHDPEKFHSRFF